MPANNKSEVISKNQQIPKLLFLLLGIAIGYSLSSIPKSSVFQKYEVGSKKSSLCEKPKSLEENSLFFPTKSGSFFRESALTRKKLDLEVARHHNNIFWLKSPIPYLMCSAPKKGTTSWNNYFLFVNEGISLTKIQQKFSGNVYTLYGRNLSASFLANVNTTNEKISGLLRKMDRIIIARNPYTRFISSYLDWLGRVNKTQAEVPFPEFVEKYQARNFSVFRGYPMNHIDPVSNWCQFSQVGYMVLKVEEQALWFNELLRRYKMETIMEDYIKKGNGIIVYKSLLNSQSYLRDFVASVIGNEAYPSELYKSTHRQNSSSYIQKFYTPEIADIVTSLFMKDFVNFQYPLWDGQPETFRHV